MRGDPIRPVVWRDGVLELIDQTVLPGRFETRTYTDWRAVSSAITDMVVRGAPAIGCAAAFAMVLAAREAASGDGGFAQAIASAATGLRSARPTAVNLSWAVDHVLRAAEDHRSSTDAARAMELSAVAVLEADVEDNRQMGRHGAALLPDSCSVITHCNAGALATGGYGTALGVIRAACEAGKRVRVYADETRPRLQGMKLTAWELMHDGIDVTLIADNMAAVLMRAGTIDAAIVGADRIAANGDTANKIGTYSLAVQCRHHAVPFYVAAPVSTFDLSLSSGAGIPIEERDGCEITHVDGVQVAPQGVRVWNPSFDVTPADLITAIVTERGVLRAPYGASVGEVVGGPRNA